MKNEKNNNKKLTALWIVSFIVAVICFVIHLKLSPYYYLVSLSFLHQVKFVFFASSIFGYAIYIQTKKPLILKVLVGILVIALIFSYLYIEPYVVNLIALFLAIVLPFIGLFGSEELFNRKKTVQAKAVIAITVILNIGILGYYGYNIGDTLFCNRGGATLTPPEVQNYNATLTQYEDKENVKGSNIQQLIMDVQTHNRDYEHDSTKWINVHVYDEDSEDALMEAERYVKNYKRISVSENTNVEDYNEMINLELGKVKKARTYAVDCVYDSDGYVIAIVIVRNKK